MKEKEGVVRNSLGYQKQDFSEKRRTKTIIFLLGLVIVIGLFSIWYYLAASAEEKIQEEAAPSLATAQGVVSLEIIKPPEGSQDAQETDS